MVACICFLCWLCQIKHHTEINEREECLDENKSLRVTYIKFSWNSTVTCKHQLWEGKRSQNDQRKKNIQRIKYDAGQIKEKRLTCYKTWVTHDHESVNYPGPACRGTCYLLKRRFEVTLMINDLRFNEGILLAVHVNMSNYMCASVMSWLFCFLLVWATSDFKNRFSNFCIFIWIRSVCRQRQRRPKLTTLGGLDFFNILHTRRHNHST